MRELEIESFWPAGIRYAAIGYLGWISAVLAAASLNQGGTALAQTPINADATPNRFEIERPKPV